MGLQDLTSSANQIVHAYEVSGRGCRISRVWNNSSNMHKRYQDGAAGHVRSGLQDLTGWELEIVHTYEVLGRGCRISRVRQTRSVQTCIRGITTGLQDLTGKKHQIEHAYEVSGWGCRLSREKNNSSNMHTRYPDGAAGSHGWGTSDRTCLQCVRSGLHDFTGWELQIVHAY